PPPARMGISTRPPPRSRRPVRSRGRVASTLTGSDSVTRTARVPSSRAMSIAILPFWRTWRRAEHGEPLPVKRQPRPVASDPFQAGIDRAYQIVLRLVDPDTVRFGLQTGPDDVQVGILHGHACQDRIVGAGRVRLTLLKSDQAVVPILNGEQGCRWRDPGD